MCANIDAISEILRALSNEHRLRIMGWLMHPRESFPPQAAGDLVKDGVCVGAITKKIGLSQPTVTNHMHVLAEAGLVSARRNKNWVFYKPVPNRCKTALAALKGLAGLTP